MGNYIYNGHLYHSGKKGMRWGYSTNPDYIPVGERANRNAVSPYAKKWVSSPRLSDSEVLRRKRNNDYYTWANSMANQKSDAYSTAAASQAAQAKAYNERKQAEELKKAQSAPKYISGTAITADNARRAEAAGRYGEQSLEPKGKAWYNAEGIYDPNGYHDANGNIVDSRVKELGAIARQTKNWNKAQKEQAQMQTRFIRDQGRYANKTVKNGGSIYGKTDFKTKVSRKLTGAARNIERKTRDFRGEVRNTADAYVDAVGDTFSDYKKKGKKILEKMGIKKKNKR